MKFQWFLSNILQPAQPLRSFGDCCLTIPCRQVLVGQKSPWNSRWKTDPKQQGNQKRISGLTSQVETSWNIYRSFFRFHLHFGMGSWMIPSDGNGRFFAVLGRRSFVPLRVRAGWYLALRWWLWLHGRYRQLCADPQGIKFHWKPAGCTDFSHLYWKKSESFK